MGALVTATGLKNTDPEFQRLIGPGKYLMDGLWNLPIGRKSSTDWSALARIQAEKSGLVNQVRTYLPFNESSPLQDYARGNGGTMLADLLPHNVGTDFANLGAAPLASGSLVLGMNGNGTWASPSDKYNMPIPMSPVSEIVAGEYYWLWYRNSDTSGNHWCGINNFHTLPEHGMPSRWGDAKNGRVYEGSKAASSSSWSWNLRTQFNPIIEVQLQNGQSFGQVQIEGGAPTPRIFTVTASATMRERWTPLVTRRCTGISVHMAASVGGSLTLRIRQGSTTLWSGTLTQASANYSADNLGGVLYGNGAWYDSAFGTVLQFNAGTAYDIEWLPQGSSQWKLITTGNGFGKFPLAWLESGAQWWDGSSWRATTHWYPQVSGSDGTGTFGAENLRWVMHLEETTTGGGGTPSEPSEPPTPLPPPTVIRSVVVAVPTDATAGVVLIGGDSPAATATGDLTAQVGQPYSLAISLTGGTGTRAVRLGGGAVPPGLALSADGTTVAGTPTVAGTYSFQLIPSDQLGDGEPLAVTITVSGATPPTWVTSSLPGANVGTPYVATLSATPAGTTFTATGLPSGASLTLDGTLRWPSPVAGTYTITVTARTPQGGTAARNFVLSTEISAADITTTSPIAAGQAGSSYSLTLAASGAGPITWTGTALPPGMSLSEAGVFAGTPLFPANYEFIVRAENAGGWDEKTLRWTVNPAAEPDRISSPWAEPLRR